MASSAKAIIPAAANSTGKIPRERATISATVGGNAGKQASHSRWRRLREAVSSMSR